MTGEAAPVARPAILPILRRSLGDGWRGLLGWSIGVAAVALLYLPLFPAMRSPELTALLDSLPPELVRTIGYQDIATGAGYVQATFFGLIGFALITIAGIGWGAAAVGTAEESGRLELTLAHGVGRIQYGLEAAGAVLVRLAVLGVVAGLIIWALNGPAELELAAANLVATVVAWVGVATLSATAAFAAGAIGGGRSAGIGVGAAVAIIGYILQALANNTSDLDVLRRFSPFAWAFGTAPLTNGADVAGLALLWGGVALLVGLGTVVLSRRDIRG